MVAMERSTIKVTAMNITIPRVYNDTREKVDNDLVMTLDPLSFSPNGPLMTLSSWGYV